MRLTGSKIYIRKLKLEDAQALLTLRVRNRAFVKPFEPVLSDAHFTLAGQTEILEKVEQNWENDSGYGFGIFLNGSERLVGRVNLTNISRGAWQSCTIGYFMDESCNGQGLTTEAVKLALEFAFNEAQLHRVQAAVMPRNIGSIRVLEKAGFRYEGLAEFYLKINGEWEHHNIYSMTHEYWRP